MCVSTQAEVWQYSSIVQSQDVHPTAKLCQVYPSTVFHPTYVYIEFGFVT